MYFMFLAAVLKVCRKKGFIYFLYHLSEQLTNDPEMNQ